MSLKSLSLLLRKIRLVLTRMISKMRISLYRSMGIKIGKRCFISLGARIDVQGGRVSIGDNVHIARGSLILAHTGFRRVNEADKTIVEDNVRIFVYAVIFPGVRMGKNSIVGAGSIVMKDVPPNVVVQGNPARVVQHLEDKA